MDLPLLLRWVWVIFEIGVTIYAPTAGILTFFGSIALLYAHDDMPGAKTAAIVSLVLYGISLLIVFVKGVRNISERGHP